eukprot:Skav227800  [mRNA]  locus=scaffold948:61574:63347:+ [translate_table: standard]
MIRGQQPKHISAEASLSQRLSSLGKKSQWQQAVAELHEIRSLGAPGVQTLPAQAAPRLGVSVYNSVIGAAGQAQAWGLATALAQQMQMDWIEPSVVTHSVLINAYGAGLWARCCQILSGARARALETNVVHYTSLLHACGQAAQVDKALEAFNDMEGDSVLPNLVSYGAAISACEKAKCWEEAMNLMQDMPLVQLEPNLVCFNSLLSSLMAAHKADEALELLCTLRDKMKPDVISFSTTLLACARSFRWKEALSTLSLMLHDVLEPNCISYDAVAHVCEKQGQIKSLFASAKLLSAVSLQGVDMCEVLR